MTIAVTGVLQVNSCAAVLDISTISDSTST